MCRALDLPGVDNGMAPDELRGPGTHIRQRGTDPRSQQLKCFGVFEATQVHDQLVDTLRDQWLDPADEFLRCAHVSVRSTRVDRRQRGDFRFGACSGRRERHDVRDGAPDDGSVRGGRPRRSVLSEPPASDARRRRPAHCCLRSCTCPRIRQPAKVVDVGGGKGAALAAILQASLCTGSAEPVEFASPPATLVPSDGEPPRASIVTFGEEKSVPSRRPRP